MGRVCREERAMARVTIEDCLKEVDSRFHLVHLAVRRVLQLRNGAAPFVNAPKNKDVVQALREIAAGKVTLDNIVQIEEARRIESSAEKEELTRAEVRDILEEATHFEGAADLNTVLEADDEEEA